MASLPSILVSNTLDETGFNWQLAGSKTQCFAGRNLRYTINLKHDPARFDTGCPKFNRTLALAHTHFSRFGSYRNIRENPYPHTPRTFHVTGDCTTCRFDLARSYAFRLLSLQSIGTKGQIC